MRDGGQFIDGDFIEKMVAHIFQSFYDGYGFGVLGQVKQSLMGNKNQLRKDADQRKSSGDFLYFSSSVVGIFKFP